MTARVLFRPADAVVPVPFTELGRSPAGAWGVVDDQGWLAAEDRGNPLDLLYLSVAAYERATRGLPADEVAAVMARRRADFSPKVPAFAVGLLEMELREVFPLLGRSPADAHTSADLISALATFTVVPSFSGLALRKLLQFVREGDARIMAELGSPSLQAFGDLDPTGEERALRRRFALDVGMLLASRGDPNASRGLPYADVERVYLITPAPLELEATARALHEPVAHLRGGLAVPVSERRAGELDAQGDVRVLFPTSAQLLSALSRLTPAQLDLEVADRLRDPGFGPYLAALRVQQATLRAAVYLIGGTHQALATVLAEHLREEAASLGTWLARGDDTRTSTVPARSGLEEALATARTLIALCRARGQSDQTGSLEPLTQAVSAIVRAVES